MKKQRLTFMTLVAATLLLVSCSSGGLGDILGGPQTSSSTSSDVYGTVNSVDTRNQRIDLTIDDYNAANRNVSINYDNRTRVIYQNQQGNPSQLERGDRVSIRMASGNVADTITVTQGVSNTGTYPNTNPTSTTGRVTGTVNSIDTSARIISVNASYVTGLRTSNNNSYTVYYDTRTRVMYQGRTYSVEDLERGDQVDITTYNSGNGNYVADTVTVTRNVRQ